jgi:hypothetical protein
MSTEFGFIGWNTVGTSDKVWGFFFRPTPDHKPTPWLADKNYGRNVCIFWAGRGKAMQFKADTYGDDLVKLVRSKLKKGYLKIGEPKLHAIWPTFQNEMEMKLSFEILTGKVK